MSLQVLSIDGLIHLGHLLNVLALVVAIAGGWLLQATRWREQQAAGRLTAADVDLETEVEAQDEAAVRMNRAFYCVGLLGLSLALSLSWLSTTL